MAATLLKGQILKVLSRFAKDVDVNQIKFSSLSQAFLSDLVLNEEVLSNVLELPIWMKLSRAVCNRVSIEIPWTHLSSQPIKISLDEVYVDIETCSELRSFSDTLPVTTSGDYGRTEMMIDGMLVNVNTLEINFRAPSFHASIQVNRITVFSTTPDYETSQDLRMTRLKDESRGLILVFKCVVWQTVRIEASSGANKDAVNRSSIRLITSAGQARIALKKHLATCELLASRLHVIMDDLLWVLTPSQLKSALSVLQEIQTLASRADKVIRAKKAAKKLKTNRGAANCHRRPVPNSSAARVTQYFEKIDVIETSYHFHLDKLNLHICDEPRGTLRPGLAKYEDAAILIELERLKLDYYPYHIQSTGRRHWLLYREPDPHFLAWQKDVLGEYLRLIEKNIPDLNMNPLQYLMYAAFVFRVDDFRLNNMTTIRSGKNGQSKPALPLCCSLKKALHLPKQCATTHLEYILHYFPQEMPFQAPPHVMQMFCNPIQLTLDVPTLDWFTLVCAEVCSTNELDLPLDFSDGTIPEILCRFEFLFPKGVCLIEMSSSERRNRAAINCLQIQSGKVVITNTQTGRNRSLLESLTSTGLAQNNFLQPSARFPDSSEDPDITIILDHLSRLAVAEVNPCLALWSITADPAWIDFVDTTREKQRPVAFVEPFPVCIWVIPHKIDLVTMLFTLVDFPVPSLKVQFTNDGYNVVLHSVDLALKVFESVWVNCQELFDAAKNKSSGDSVLISAVARLRKIEFSLLLDSTDPSERLSSAQMSETSSLRPGSVDNILTPSLFVSVESKKSDLFAASVRDDFDEYPFRDGDVETLSMHSVMSESSISDFGSIPSTWMGMDDIAAALPDVSGAGDAFPLISIDAIADIPTASRVSDFSVDRDTIEFLVVEIIGIDVVFASCKMGLFTKLKCGELLLLPPKNTLPNGTPDERDGSQEKCLPSENTPFSGKFHIALRFHAEESKDGAPRSLLTVLCQGCSLNCPAEASALIGDLFKSDLAGEPLPLLLHLRDFGLTFSQKDKAKALSGFWIDELTCTRGSDGIFLVEPSYREDTEIAPKGPSLLSVSDAHQRLLLLKQKQSLIAEEIQSIYDRILAPSCP